MDVTPELLSIWQSRRPRSRYPRTTPILTHPKFVGAESSTTHRDDAIHLYCLGWSLARIGQRLGAIRPPCWPNSGSAASPPATPTDVHAHEAGQIDGWERRSLPQGRYVGGTHRTWTAGNRLAVAASCSICRAVPANTDCLSSRLRCDHGEEYRRQEGTSDGLSGRLSGEVDYRA